MSLSEKELKIIETGRRMKSKNNITDYTFRFHLTSNQSFSICILDNISSLKKRAMKIRDYIKDKIEDMIEKPLIKCSDYYRVRIPNKHYFLYFYRDTLEQSIMSIMHECYRIALLVLEDKGNKIDMDIHEQARLLSWRLFDQCKISNLFKKWGLEDDKE